MQTLKTLEGCVSVVFAGRLSNETKDDYRFSNCVKLSEDEEKVSAKHPQVAIDVKARPLRSEFGSDVRVRVEVVAEDSPEDPTLVIEDLPLVPEVVDEGGPTFKELLQLRTRVVEER